MLMKVHTDVNITVLSTRDFLFNLYDQKRQEIVRQITLLCLLAIFKWQELLLHECTYAIKQTSGYTIIYIMSWNNAQV